MSFLDDDDDDDDEDNDASNGHQNHHDNSDIKQLEIPKHSITSQTTLLQSTQHVAASDSRASSQQPTKSIGNVITQSLPVSVKSTTNTPHQPIEPSQPSQPRVMVRKNSSSSSSSTISVHGEDCVKMPRCQNHYFHRDCIASFVKLKDHCPVCNIKLEHQIPDSCD